MEEIKLQVLLIEDSEVDYVGLKRAFDLTGIKCDLHVAKTGEDGLKNLVDLASMGKRLPIVLLDINLPGQSGLETLKLIRTSPLTTDTRVVVWSSIQDPTEVEIANDLEIEGFLLKSDMISSYMKAATMLNDYWRLDTQ